MGVTILSDVVVNAFTTHVATISGPPMHKYHWQKTFDVDFSSSPLDPDEIMPDWRAMNYRELVFFVLYKLDPEKVSIVFDVDVIGKDFAHETLKGHLGSDHIRAVMRDSAPISQFWRVNGLQNPTDWTASAGRVLIWYALSVNLPASVWRALTESKTDVTSLVSVRNVEVHIDNELMEQVLPSLVA